MMISTKSYYETALKGKTKQELRAIVRELREDIKALKEEVQKEEGAYINPSPDVRLSMTQDYARVARAVLVLKEHGIL